jgi:hypothetical protein
MQLTDDWIVGFVDGDGCFKIIDTSSNERRYCFVVSQEKRSVDVLYALQKRLKCGSVNRAGGNMREFRVTKKEDLLKYILPFFETYSLKTQKWYDFKVVFEELTGQALGQRQSIKISREWLVGFSDAEACFYVSMVKNYPRPQFLIGLNSRDEEILNIIQEFLGCGIVYPRKSNKANASPCTVYQISSMEGFQKIIETFTTGQNRVLLRTTKRISFLKFKQIIRLIQKKEHLTEEGIRKILKIRKSGSFEKWKSKN